MTEAPTRALCFVFTINNYNEADIQNIKNIGNDVRVKRLVAETETGEEGTRHIQGYISFHKRWYRRNVENLLGGRAYLARAQGSPLQNYHYCSKDGTVFVEKGFEDAKKIEEGLQKKNEKKDEKALEILQDINALSEAEFIRKHAWFYLYKQKEYRSFRTVVDQERLQNYDGDLKEKNLWIYGGSGTGKSRLVDSWTSPDKILRKTNNKWFDGYTTDQEFVVIDDITPALHNDTARTIKNLADRYKFIVEVKNGTKVISPADYCLVITSNYTVEQVFTNPEDVEPIKRRFTIINMDDIVTFGGTVEEPSYIQVLRKKKQELMDLTLVEALKKISEDMEKEQNDPVNQVSQALNEIQYQRTHSQRRKTSQDESQRRSRRMQRTQITDSDEDLRPDSSDGTNPHPVFQGHSTEESETEDWKIPQRYIPTEQNVKDFTDYTTESEEDEGGVRWSDPSINHSDHLGRDPLLEALNKSDSEEPEEEESTEIDLDITETDE